MKKPSSYYLKNLIIMVLLFLLVLPTTAMAAGGIELSTTYPGIVAGPGETISFPLDLNNSNSEGQIVTLRIDGIPEGWRASIEGNGRQIHQVYVKGKSSESANLKVEVPENVKAGDYSVDISALKNGSPLDSLKVSVKVSMEPSGEDKLKAQYRELKGPGDATFNFKLNLTNNSNTEQLYSLGAKVPQGWQITFKPSYESQQVASISVKEGSTQGLDVSITPAANVEAGEYVIPVQAASSTGVATEELKVIITGTYSMKFSTPTGRLNADVVAGRDKKVALVVENTGSAPLNGISFSASTPENWTVEFDPDIIDVLNPGESAQVTALITADAKAISGDYVVSMKASTRETSQQANFRVTVKTSTLWGVVGVAFVVLICAGIYWVFNTYGRR